MISFSPNVSPPERYDINERHLPSTFSLIGRRYLLARPLETLITDKNTSFSEIY
jgi:hypothetical protein